MCLAVPMEVKKLDGYKAVVETGGVETEVDITLYPELVEGDSVLVHAGFVIEKLDPEEAELIEKTWEEYLESLEQT